MCWTVEDSMGMKRTNFYVAALLVIGTLAFLALVPKRTPRPANLPAEATTPDGRSNPIEDPPVNRNLSGPDLSSRRL